MGRRLAATSATASRLGGVVTSGQSPDGTNLRDQVLASGADANQVVDAIVEAVRPVDGTQDAEASRRALGVPGHEVGDTEALTTRRTSG